MNYFSITCRQLTKLKMKKVWILLPLFLAICFDGTIAATATAENCKENEPQQCAVRADTLLKDPDLVFPDNPTSVDRVCRTWSDFTACIYDYTKRCLTRQQKAQFDRSFKDPVASMSTLCEDTAFRREYLLYAPCIKKVSTEDKNCGHQYRFLIDHMSGSSTSVKQICCARAKFKKCVLEKTRQKCDSVNDKSLQHGNVELNATAFAVKALDKSLAFVSQQCSFSGFREEECPGIRENSKGPLDSNLQSDAAAAASDEVPNKKPQQPAQTHFQIPRRTTPKPKQEKLSENLGNSLNARLTGLYFHLQYIFLLMPVIVSQVLF